MKLYIFFILVISIGFPKRESSTTTTTRQASPEYLSRTSSMDDQDIQRIVQDVNYGRRLLIDDLPRSTSVHQHLNRRARIVTVEQPDKSTDIAIKEKEDYEDDDHQTDSRIISSPKNRKMNSNRRKVIGTKSGNTSEPGSSN